MTLLKTIIIYEESALLAVIAVDSSL